jgi:ATP-binding cassette subfamily B protein
LSRFRRVKTASTDDLLRAAWPLARAGEALAALGVQSRIATAGESPGAPDADAMTGGERETNRALGRWIEAAAAWLGMEAEPAPISYLDLCRRLPGSAPALVRIPAAGEPRLLAILGGSRRRVSLLTPERTTRQVASRRLAGLLGSAKQASLGKGIDAILENLTLSASQRARVGAAVLDQRLRLEELDGVWLLRPDPSSSFTRQVARAGLWGRLGALASAHAAEYVCWILAWWVVGLGAMQGRIDRGWLLAWALLLLTMVPLRVAVTWLQGTIAIAGGAILKQRLLVGALRMEPDEIRLEGAGHLLGRVMESEAVESLALSGGFLALVSLIELLLAAVVLAAGAGAPLEVSLLVLWTALILWLGRRYLACSHLWAESRIRLTHGLVERMIGHRTRVAQEVPERWHEGEDEELERYIDVARQMDRRAAWLMTLAARGWLLLAVAALAPSFLGGSATPASLAVAIGGALLGYRALRRLAAGVWHLADAWVAWRQVAPLFRAGARRERPGAPAFVLQAGRERPETAVLQAEDLTFRYRARPDPVLKGVSVRVGERDRILLEGPSGAGKSTLASVLVGMRAPDSGLLLAGGLDRETLGAQGWRRRVASAPQFHENHVITGTLAFNVLMSRPDWPPGQEDVDLIEPLFRELGLDGLLERMPQGVRQMVGESGWQLSHGELGRLFLARALLQDASLVVLDESFACLDPENLRLCLACVRKRAPSLLLITHR